MEHRKNVAKSWGVGKKTFTTKDKCLLGNSTTSPVKTTATLQALKAKNKSTRKINSDFLS